MALLDVRLTPESHDGRAIATSAVIPEVGQAIEVTLADGHARTVIVDGIVPSDGYFNATLTAHLAD